MIKLIPYVILYYNQLLACCQAQAKVLAVVQKPANISGLVNVKSGPQAWKQLPTWYQVSQDDHVIPPAVERMFAKQMNATTIALPSSSLDLFFCYFHYCHAYRKHGNNEYNMHVDGNHPNYSFDYRNHGSPQVVHFIKNLVTRAETLGFDSFSVMDY